MIGRKRSFSEVLEIKMERSKRDCSNPPSNVYYIVIIDFYEAMQPAAILADEPITNGSLNY
jgi:hypothetical protein